MDKRHLPRILRRAGVGIFLVSVGLLAGETARAQPSPPPTLNFAVRLPPDFEYSFGAFSVRPGVPAGQIELLVSGPTLAARRAEGETVGRVRLNLASRSISQLGPLFNPGGVIWNDRHLIWGLAHIGGRILQSRREYYNVSGENHPWLAHSGDLDGFTSPVGPFQELAFPNNYTAAHLIPIPASFGSAYLGGDNVGFGASGVSGATSTGGPALFSTVVPSADFAGHPILYYPHDRPETWIAGLPDRFTGEPSAWNNSSYVSGGTFTAGDDALFGGVQGYRPRPAPGSSNASMRVEARLVRYGAAALGQHAVAVRAGTANPWDLQPTQVIDLTPVHYYSDAHEEMIWHYTHVKVFPGSVPPRFYTEAEAEAVWISIANTVPYAYTDADGTTWRARDLGFLLPVWDRVNNLLLVMAQNGYLEADGWQNRPILYVLTYTTPSGRPVITRHPANQTVIVGQAATFSVQASGDAPLSYQWQRNGVNIAGAIASNYTTPATTLADNGAQFRSVVTNAAGSATSNAATLTVTPPPPAPSSRSPHPLLPQSPLRSHRESGHHLPRPAHPPKRPRSHHLLHAVPPQRNPPPVLADEHALPGIPRVPVFPLSITLTLNALRSPLSDPRPPPRLPAGGFRACDPSDGLPLRRVRGDVRRLHDRGVRRVRDRRPPLGRSGPPRREPPRVL
ncbi:MAG: hypothetical protein G01um101438_384 [Parcubacteria group bacterium Gr01-1014_38]|nr:MAG: hypothetical protein G01um101438_384 [Parcubacteria group bacterium Gr01-1014_38]